MKLNFSAVINDLEGNPCKDAKGDNATLGSITVEALMATFPDEQNLLGADKVKRFRLAEQAFKGGTQEVEVDDVALLKTLIGKAYGPLVVGRAYDLIEG